MRKINRIEGRRRGESMKGIIMFAMAIVLSVK